MDWKDFALFMLACWLIGNNNVEHCVKYLVWSSEDTYVF